VAGRLLAQPVYPSSGKYALPQRGEAPWLNRRAAGCFNHHIGLEICECFGFLKPAHLTRQGILPNWLRARGDADQFDVAVSLAKQLGDAAGDSTPADESDA
jgi:hypothetical protein